MKELINPYANALDGLEINNPVTAFFNFCKEREKIRLKRESGTAFPWTDDPIFQKGRFLNVFREDDRGSKAILKFANNLDEDLPTLIHALFFSRWCNRQEILDTLTSSILSKPTKLADKLKAKGYKYTEVKLAMHPGTYKVFCDFEGVADITEMDPRQHKILVKNSIKKKIRGKRKGGIGIIKK